MFIHAEFSEGSNNPEAGRKRDLLPGRSRDRAFCILCDQIVRLVTPQESEEMFKANWVELMRLTEQGKIHRIHNSRGRIRICFNSLQGIEKEVRTQEFVFLKPCNTFQAPGA
jgi:hypothetical protein